jgi:beta-lactamase regulating signal transducer with metallopeptidase domain
MMPFDLDPATSAALSIAVKASVLLGAAALVQAVLYRRVSAAMRHLVWTLTVAGLLLLPILSLSLPAWTVVIRTAARAVDAGPAIARPDEPAAPAQPSAFVAARPESAAGVRPAAGTTLGRVAADADASRWPAVMAGVYVTGVFVMLIYMALQQGNVRRLAREAADVRDPDWTRLLRECAVCLGVDRPVRLLRSRERSMPMAFGTRQPTILIPATADTWPEDRQRAVVLHELAHVARYDCLTQSLAFAACTMYWFHPATWWVARRLRIERELACDDRAIAAGARAREYAGHLLEIAYTFGRHRAPAVAVSMARPRHLEGRMLAVLDGARNRREPSMRVRIAGSALAAALLVPLASATTTVGAVAPDAGPVSANTPSVPVLHQAPLADRQLKSIDAPPLVETARRLVRAAAAAIGIPQENAGLPGTWEIRPTGREGTIHLRLVELRSSSGSNIPIERLEGLTAAQLAGTGGPVQFRLRRDAGTFNFEGVLRSGVGAGTFSFTPDPAFPAELARRGFAQPTAAEQYQMARHDVGFAFLDELTRQGYAKPGISEIVRAGQHGVEATYLRDMGALGYRLGSLPPLIELRDHGITPEYVREMADLGYKGLSPDAIRRARDHGITPEHVRAMRDAGYGSLTLEQLITSRDHGVTAEFVRDLADAGHRKLAIDEVIRVRDHGVTPEYVREMRRLGHDLALDELIRVRDHGVDVEYARRMAALGYKVPAATLVRLRDHGVTPDYVEELKALGYDRLAAEDLVTLRDHGLTAERVRRANARAGTRLPIDMLKSLAAGGMRD